MVYTVGPLAELEYWRQRTSKFSYLVDQIKSQPCRGVIATLSAAKSRSLKVLIHLYVYCTCTVFVYVGVERVGYAGN